MKIFQTDFLLSGSRTESGYRSCLPIKDQVFPIRNTGSRSWGQLPRHYSARQPDGKVADFFQEGVGRAGHSRAADVEGTRGSEGVGAETGSGESRKERRSTGKAVKHGAIRVGDADLGWIQTSSDMDLRRF